jgi:hypothetical protein
MTSTWETSWNWMEKYKNTELNQGFLFFSSLWCKQTGDGSQEDLAKFGHRPDMKKVSVYETMAQSHHVMRMKNEVTIFRQ